MLETLLSVAALTFSLHWILEAQTCIAQSKVHEEVVFHGWNGRSWAARTEP